MTTTPAAPPPTGLGTCSACKFWDPANDLSQGLCRYHAPDRPTSLGGRALWPVCGPDDWCGQWVTK